MDLSLYPANVDLTQIPALNPPSGITPDFVDPATRANLTLISCAGIVAVMLLFVMLRIYTKVYVIQTTGWDDCKQIRPLSTGRKPQKVDEHRHVYLCRCKVAPNDSIDQC